MPIFEIMQQSWYKRRRPDTNPPNVISFEVSNFKLINNHYCDVWVKFDDGTVHNLTARVSLNCTYHVNGTQSNERWTVHGLGENGISILLKVIQNDVVDSTK